MVISESNPRQTVNNFHFSKKNIFKYNADTRYVGTVVRVQLWILFPRGEFSLGTSPRGPLVEWLSLPLIRFSVLITPYDIWSYSPKECSLKERPERSHRFESSLNLILFPKGEVS